MKTTKHRFMAKFLIILILPILLSLSSCNGNKPFNLNADNINYIKFKGQFRLFSPAKYTKEDPEFYELIELVNSFEYVDHDGPRISMASGGSDSVWFGKELHVSIGYVMAPSEGEGKDYRVIESCYGESYDGPSTLIAKDTEFCERLMEYGFPGWTLEKENAERDATWGGQ